MNQPNQMGEPTTLSMWNSLLDSDTDTEQRLIRIKKY